jgi:uncharacterized protein YoaH (UPF0181 family)
MEPKTQKKILQAIDRLYSGFGRAMGLEGYDAVLQFLLVAVEQPGARQEIARGAITELGYPKDQLKGAKLHKALTAIKSREQVKARLAALPEPDAVTLKQFLTTAKNRPLLSRAALLPVAKKLPHPAGKKPSLTPQERKEVYEQIQCLIAGGMRTKEAQRIVAGRWSRSLRTIQRVCAEQRELPSPSKTVP